ncbi:alpha-ketoglutarate-dependent dioxygenase AlkB [Flavobacterium sp. HJ-32-4]|nr:alpha-ketoglutarate-dependent dioxygenase AlkB [Flavobacterium sp. HJ-32-4]UMY67229.1 alpha-ketoglutarate-dependent dioxygenase AlkB [Flavobacterium sp. HJ-32-4]
MLFEEERTPVRFDLRDAEVTYYPSFFTHDKADELFSFLLENTAWQQDDIVVFGKSHPQPRLTALYGNEGKPYAYSNIVMHPHAWTPALMFIKEAVEQVCADRFTTVLLNLYRDGRDSNGWHADNERELGRDPLIASVSLGAERMFHLRHNQDASQALKLRLEHGSLLLMGGTTQHFWKHQIPKTARPTGPRINLTFRILK